MFTLFSARWFVLSRDRSLQKLLGGDAKAKKAKLAFSLSDVRGRKCQCRGGTRLALFIPSSPASLQVLSVIPCCHLCMSRLKGCARWQRATLSFLRPTSLTTSKIARRASGSGQISLWPVQVREDLLWLDELVFIYSPQDLGQCAAQRTEFRFSCGSKITFSCNGSACFRAGDDTVIERLRADQNRDRIVPDCSGNEMIRASTHPCFHYGPERKYCRHPRARESTRPPGRTIDRRSIRRNAPLPQART